LPCPFWEIVSLESLCGTNGFIPGDRARKISMRARFTGVIRTILSKTRRRDAILTL
jgi:hypothetical protein